MPPDKTIVLISFVSIYMTENPAFYYELAKCFFRGKSLIWYKVLTAVTKVMSDEVV